MFKETVKYCLNINKINVKCLKKSLILMFLNQKTILGFETLKYTNTFHPFI